MLFVNGCFETKLLERLWPNVDGYRMVKGGEMEGDTFGTSSYKLNEIAADSDQLTQEPYFFVWLHGSDGGGDTPRLDLGKMQKRLRRRTFSLFPLARRRRMLHVFSGVSDTPRRKI